MKNQKNEANHIGYVAAAVITGVTAFVSYDSLHIASVILYNNQFILPYITTLIIAFLSFGGVFAYPYLEKPAGRLIDTIKNDFGKEDELDVESWRRE